MIIAIILIIALMIIVLKKLYFNVNGLLVVGTL